MRVTTNLRLVATVLAMVAVACDETTFDDTESAEPSQRSSASQAQTSHHGSLDASLPSTPPSSAADASAPEGTLFGATVSSYATTAQGSVTSVGVVIPLAAIAAAPQDSPFQDDLVLDMPAAAKEQTFLSQLRVNWLAYGHGPSPYGESHFDFHFHRGSSSEIDAIACGGAARFPPEILTADHQFPTTCVSGMGYHAWPRADALPSATFTASLILGYTPTELVFIEPMITQATLLARRDFELAITPPAKTGGGPTRFPTRMRARYSADGLTVRLEFDTFVDIE